MCGSLRWVAAWVVKRSAVVSGLQADGSRMLVHLQGADKYGDGTRQVPLKAVFESFGGHATT